MSDPIEFANLIADVREQVLYLKELGIDALDAPIPETRTASAEPRAEAGAPREPLRRSGSERSAPPPEVAVPKPPAKAAGRKAPGSRIAALPSLAKRTKPAVIPAAVSPPSTEASGTEVPSPATDALTVSSPATADTIESIRAEIGECARCPLYTGRTQVVHSTGNFEADLMFVGEAPGADEDAQGVPFVGRAGQLLTKIIEGIGLRREDVFIGNINRCRPPGNRQPFPDEAAICRPFLLREIDVVKPKVIVVLGAHAAHNLLQVKTPISKLRGQFHEYFGVKVMPTFHPAYLLRDPHKKRDVWEDMKKVRDLLAAK